MRIRLASIFAVSAMALAGCGPEPTVDGLADMALEALAPSLPGPVVVATGALDTLATCRSGADLASDPGACVLRAGGTVVRFEGTPVREGSLARLDLNVWTTPAGAGSAERTNFAHLTARFRHRGGEWTVVSFDENEIR